MLAFLTLKGNVQISGHTSIIISKVVEKLMVNVFLLAHLWIFYFPRHNEAQCWKDWTYSCRLICMCIEVCVCVCACVCVYIPSKAPTFCQASEKLQVGALLGLFRFLRDLVTAQRSWYSETDHFTQTLIYYTQVIQSYSDWACTDTQITNKVMWIKGQ